MFYDFYDVLGKQSTSFCLSGYISSSVLLDRHIQEDHGDGARIQCFL